MAPRDDGITVDSHYWLRSVGPGFEQDIHFRTVANVSPIGFRDANHAGNINRGIRPSLKIDFQ